jgi:hypothetical protein
VLQKTLRAPQRPISGSDRILAKAGLNSYKMGFSKAKMFVTFNKEGRQQYLQEEIKRRSLLAWLGLPCSNADF